MNEVLRKQSGPDSDHDGKLWATKYLHRAASHGWLGLVDILIRDGLDIDHPYQQGRTALCKAAEEGHAQVVDTLLKAGANRNFRTTTGADTPIILAARKGHEEVVKLLLEAGADMSQENAFSKTARALAEEGGHGTAVQMLAQREHDGPLVETSDGLCSDVDAEFKATIVDFNFASDVHQHSIEEISVDKLLEIRGLEYLGQDMPSLKWIHLPANNVSVEMVTSSQVMSANSFFR